MLKSGRFSRVFAEYLKNGSTDFYQTHVIFRQLSIIFFEIKRLKTGRPSCYGNQFMRECWTKNHDEREEKWHLS